MRRVLSGGLAALLLMAAAGNIAGVARYPGGPLQEMTDDHGPLLLQLGSAPVLANVDLVAAAPADDPGYLAAADLKMVWPARPTVERVEPVWVGEAPSVLAVLVRVPEGTASNAVTLEQGARFVRRAVAGTYAEAPVRIEPWQCCEPVPQVVVRLGPSRPGRYQLAGVWIDYRVGPLAFRMFAQSGDSFELTTA